MTKFGAAENEMKRLTAKFAQGTPAEYSLLGIIGNFTEYDNQLTYHRYYSQTYQDNFKTPFFSENNKNTGLHTAFNM